VTASSATTRKGPLIAVIAGEHSGDILGAGLMQALKQQHPEVSFIGVGGPLMEAQGLSSLVPMEDLAVMGLAEVLRHLPKLLRHRKAILSAVGAAQPDVFVGIDAPDFNLPIAKKLKAQGIATVHYVSPSVWAWRQGRIHGIKAAVDHVLCLLPFEKAFYDDHQLAATFVGHPLADEIPLHSDKQAARAALGLASSGQWVGILPGSRGGELARLAPHFLQAAQQLHRKYPALQFVAPMINAKRSAEFRALQQQLAPEVPIQMIDGQARTVMAACDALMLTSGTVTLEALLIKRPMVVAYRFTWLSYQVIKRMFKAAYFSLPNLLAQRALVPELRQNEVTAERIVAEIEPLLRGDNPALNASFEKIHLELKREASVHAAKAVCQYISK